jgi:hypothetical protein
MLDLLILAKTITTATNTTETRTTKHIVISGHTGVISILH